MTPLNKMLGTETIFRKSLVEKTRHFLSLACFKTMLEFLFCLLLLWNKIFLLWVSTMWVGNLLTAAQITTGKSKSWIKYYLTPKNIL